MQPVPAVKTLGRTFTAADLRSLDAPTALALRWHALAQTIPVREDRYIALWVSLEALAGGPGTDLLKRIWELFVQAVGREEADAARPGFDLRALRDLRNRLVAGTAREQAPTIVEYAVSDRSVALVDALVADTLRSRLGIEAEKSLAKRLVES